MSSPLTILSVSRLLEDTGLETGIEISFPHIKVIVIGMGWEKGSYYRRLC